MRRYERSDEEWAIIAPLLPNKPRGAPRVDDRRVINGIWPAPLEVVLPEVWV